MPKFRKKPVVIEAWHFSPDGGPKPHWLENALNEGRIYFQGGEDTNQYFTIETTEGTMRADPGDWIIKGIESELYPCKNSVFMESYESAEPESEQAA